MRYFKPELYQNMGKFYLNLATEKKFSDQKTSSKYIEEFNSMLEELCYAFSDTKNKLYAEIYEELTEKYLETFGEKISEEVDYDNHNDLYKILNEKKIPLGEK